MLKNSIKKFKNVLTVLILSLLLYPSMTHASALDTFECVATVGFYCPSSTGSTGGSSYSTSGSSGYYSTTSYSGSGSGWNMGNYGSYGLPTGTITGIITGILNWILMLFGIIGIIGFIIAGIMYILSAGDEDTMKKAKNAMKWSIIGVVVGLSGVVVLQAVSYALNMYSGF